MPPKPRKKRKAKPRPQAPQPAAAVTATTRPLAAPPALARPRSDQSQAAVVVLAEADTGFSARRATPKPPEPSTVLTPDAEHELLLDPEPEPESEPERQQQQLQPYVRTRHEKSESAAAEGKAAAAAGTAPQIAMEERPFDFFINHCQKSGQDQCRTLATELERRGCRVWYDMQAEDLTAAGMELGVAQSRNVLMFLSNELMSRPFCLSEQRWGIKYGCRFVGVVEKDSRHGPADFAKEKAAAPEDLQHLLDDVEFVDFQRREFLLQALIDEICKRGGCDPSRRKQVLPAVAEPEPEEEGGMRTHSMLALQNPPMLVGASTSRAAVAERLGEIEDALRDRQEEWLSKRRYPICLSDASVYAENDLVSQISSASVRCVVWFGRGDGWDSRRTPGLQQIAETISSVQAEASRPQIAVVCLLYGSRQAAQRLLDAGVTTVLWLTADGLSDACAEL
eukprot:COSAG06_NODE_9957_length_1782_cov_19.099822_2_plen_451_part_01